MNSGRVDDVDPQEEDEEDYNDGVVLVDPTDIEMCSDDEDTELTIDCEFDDIQETPNLVIKIFTRVDFPRMGSFPFECH